MKTWLVLDVHYLCHRAFHTTKALSWNGSSTGVIFGFLKSITALKDEFQTDNVVFCFEHKNLFRRDIYPPYKKKRHTQERTPEEIESLKNLSKQIHSLRTDHLPRIGFKNVFSIDGMESDDIMACIAARESERGDSVILVTADQDLFQCLNENVSIYSPTNRMIVTKSKFIATYGIAPRRWAVVKAIAGCTSDEVKGVGGVGEKTALRYLKGELKPESAAYQRLQTRESREIVRRNRALVQLPFKGCIVPELQPDSVSKKKWIEVCNDLGMKSLASHPPVASRKMIGNA